MSRLILTLGLLLLTCGTASAQGSEQYLPSGSQIVLQIDPPEKTKAAADKTAFGEMWNGETGKFFTAFYRHAVETAELAAQHFKVPADDVALMKEGLRLAERLVTQGMALGIEANGVLPPNARMVMVFSGLGTGEGNLPAFVAKLLDKAGAPPP